MWVVPTVQQIDYLHEIFLGCTAGIIRSYSSVFT